MGKLFMLQDAKIHEKKKITDDKVSENEEFVILPHNIRTVNYGIWFLWGYVEVSEIRKW